MTVAGALLLAALRRAAGPAVLAGLGRTLLVGVVGAVAGAVAGRLVVDAVLGAAGGGLVGAVLAAVAGAVVAVALPAGAFVTLDRGALRVGRWARS
jgi:putative peptidoglycan lipid II flippase